MNRTAQSLLILLATMAGTVSIVVLMDSVGSLTLAGGIGLTGASIASIVWWGSTKEEFAPEGKEIAGGEERATFRWQGTEVGATRWMPADAVWMPAIGFLVAGGTEAAIIAINAGAPPVFTLVWPATIVLSGVFFYRRYRLFTRPPNRVTLRKDGTIVVEETIEHDATRVSGVPNHILHRHGDGSLTLVFGSVQSIGRMYLRFVAGSAVDWPWLRKSIGGVDLLLVRVWPGQELEEALEPYSGSG